MPTTSAWVNPYYETTIGLGFSGSCFEALTVIAHVSELLCSLVVLKGDNPLPTGKGLVNLIAKLCESYFEKHSGDNKPLVKFLIFGFDGNNPWIGKITWDDKNKLSSSIDNQPNEKALVTIGQDSDLQKNAKKLLNQIFKHKEKISGKPIPATTNGDVEHDLKVARHDVLGKKVIEEQMISKIESDLAETIGGVLHQLELEPYNGRAVAGFTRDDRLYLSMDTYSVATNAILSPIPIVSKMRRQT